MLKIKFKIRVFECILDQKPSCYKIAGLQRDSQNMYIYITINCMHMWMPCKVCMKSKRECHREPEGCDDCDFQELYVLNLFRI